MKKLVDRAASKITNKYLRIIGGIFICLLSVFVALSTANATDPIIYVPRFLNWCVSFLVGSVLAYVVYGILFLLGLRMIFLDKKSVRRTFNYTILGIIFVVIGSMILITNAMSYEDGVPLTFSNFVPYIKQYVVQNFPNVAISKNGGIIGMLLVALIDSGMGFIGGNIFGSIFISLGAIFVLAKPVIRFAKFIKDYADNTFHKKLPESKPEFSAAKEVKYDYQSIEKSETEELETEQIIKEPNRADIGITNTKFDVKENNDDMIDTRQTIVRGTSSNLQKAVFNPNDTKDYSQNMFTSAPKPEEKVEKVEEPVKSEEVLPKMYDYSNRYDMDNPDRVFVNATEVEEPEEVIESELTKEVFAEEKPIENELTHENEYNSSYIEQPEIVHEEPIIQHAEQKITREEPKVDLKPKKRIPFREVSLELLLSRPSESVDAENKRVNDERMAIINQTLDEFKVGAQVISYTTGPSVTQFDLKTNPGVSINGINRYMNDIFIQLGGLRGRFVDIVDGKSTSGIEIPNYKVRTVDFKDCMKHLPNDRDHLYVAMGVNISGEYVYADLCEFPHLLVAGTTGSGKSVFNHSLILSLIMRHSPQDVKLIMVDPKKVEFTCYKEDPHLLCPPVNDPQKAYIALLKLTQLMDERYTLFENNRCQKISQYNAKMREQGKETIPYIVVFVDEFADLMQTNKKCEEPIKRLGQKARACGIHLVIATQRPTTDVITGTIKANLPSRVALSVNTYIDSATILSVGGAEKLNGHGDMLIMCSEVNRGAITRCQSAFVTDDEIFAVVNDLFEKYPREYDERFMDLEEKTRTPENEISYAEVKAQKYDDIYQQIRDWTMSNEYISISRIQQQFQLGYPKAATFYKQLTEEGIVSDNKEKNSAKGALVLIHNPGFKTLEETLNEKRGGSIEVSEMDYSKKL